MLILISLLVDPCAASSPPRCGTAIPKVPEVSGGGASGTQDGTEVAVRMRAKELHAEAIRTAAKGNEVQANQAWNAARAAYRKWFLDWGWTTQSYEMHLGFAQALYASKEYSEAHDEYLRVVLLNPGDPRSPQCLGEAIFSLGELLHEQAEEGRGELDLTGALTPIEEKQLATLDLFVALYPDSSEVVGKLHAAGRLLYYRGMVNQAATRFRAAIQVDPTSADAEHAANLIIDGFTEARNWSALVEYGEFFIEQEGLGDPKFKSEVRGIVAAARIHASESLKK